jgi:hypothetical protein
VCLWSISVPGSTFLAAVVCRFLPPNPKLNIGFMQSCCCCYPDTLYRNVP